MRLPVRCIHAGQLSTVTHALRIAYTSHRIQQEGQFKYKAQTADDFKQFRRFSSTKHWGEGRSSQFVAVETERPVVGR
jgi:hypothetical protein